MLKLENRILRQNKSLLGSKEDTKNKIRIEWILSYMDIRLKHEEDISIRNISLCDYQVYLTRMLKKRF